MFQLGTFLLGFATILSFAGIIINHRRKNRAAVLTDWPVVGMLPELLQNFRRVHDFATEKLRESGGTLDFKGPWFVKLDFLITCDPSNIQHILTTNFANYPKGDEFREVFDVLGDGILNADSDLWKLQRKMFHLWNGRSKTKFDLLVAKVMERKVVDALIPFLDHVVLTGIQVDLQAVFRQLITFDNAIQLIFGVDPESSDTLKLPKSEYQKAFEYMDKVVLHRHVLPMRLWKLQRWLQIGSEREFTRARKKFDEFMYHCLSLKRQKRTNNQTNKNDDKEEEEESFDMLNVYMEEAKENPYPDKFLKDVAMSFIAASKDTLNASLTWFFWLIATHPKVEKKILEEMRQNNFGSINNNCYDLNNLVYLKATLLEMFRLYPALPFNHKSAAKEDTLPSGHRVKRNHRILISYYSMGRMEEIWGRDCLEFKPERWVSESGEFLYVPSHKYAAFSTGPRTCLGKDMILVQMKVMAIWVLRHYKIEVVEGHPISPDLFVTLSMKYGLKVKVSRRKIF